MATVTQVDAEKVLTDWLYAILPSIPQAAGYTVGTRVEPNVTPVKAIRVRLVGGTTGQRVTARPRLDVRIWSDGSAATEGAAKTLARILHGRMEAELKVRTFMIPTPMPDPADGSKTLIMMTVELLLRGVQS